MAKSKRCPKGVLYARYSKEDIAALRAIRKATKSVMNPDGPTAGEQQLLELILKLGRKSGYSYATNAT